MTSLRKNPNSNFRVDRLSSSGLGEDSAEVRALVELAKVKDDHSVRTVRKHARAALRHDPECSAAFVLLARVCSTPEESGKHYRKAMSAGREKFAEQIAAITRQRGLWTHPECRLFMEAGFEFGAFLCDANRFEEAIEVFRELLWLNYEDEQGIRHELLRALVAVNDFEGAERLLEEYPDDATCFWAYGRAFLAFTRALGETGWTPPPEAVDVLRSPFATLPKKAFAKAEKLIEKAIRETPFVPLFAADLRTTVVRSPETWDRGSPEEALVYARSWSPIWTTPILPALWLMRRAMDLNLPGLIRAAGGVDEAMAALESLDAQLFVLPPEDLNHPALSLFADLSDSLREALLEEMDPGLGAGMIPFSDWDDDVPRRKKSKRKTKSKKKKPAPKAVYEIEIVLRDSDPPIWRRVQVPDDITFEGLHHVVQAAMGWTDSHLHCFTFRDERFEPQHPENFEDSQDSAEFRLDDVVKRAKGRIVYEYDFGDDWVHDLTVEKILRGKDAPALTRPVCLGGERNCPPEDCGGIYGFYGLLEAIGNPKHPDHHDMLEWAGDYDPDHFDPALTNEILEELFK